MSLVQDVGLTVKPLKDVSPGHHVIRNDVQQSHHLGEEQDAMPIRFELHEEFVEKHHFSSVHDEAANNFIPWLITVFSTVE